MNRRDFLKRTVSNIAGLATGIRGLMASDPAVHAMEIRQRPNVVMICVDDLHPYAVKGRSPYIKTPAIDTLKESGVDSERKRWD